MATDNEMGSQLNGQKIDVTSPVFDALGLAWRRIADREGMSRNLTESGETPDRSERAKPSLTSTGKTNFREGTVFHPTASLSQNFLVPKSTVVGPEITPISSPVFAGFSRSEDHEEGRRRGESDSRDRSDCEVGGLVNPGYGEMLARLNEVQEFYNEAFPNEAGKILGTRENGSSDDPYYFRSSPTIQVSSPSRAQSGLVPERFHAGRESLSVTRNITVRESKRPKARTQDRDYKRRYSTSGPILTLPLHHEVACSSGGKSHISKHHFMVVGEMLRMMELNKHLDQGYHLYAWTNPRVMELGAEILPREMDLLAAVNRQQVLGIT